MTPETYEFDKYWKNILISLWNTYLEFSKPSITKIFKDYKKIRLYDLDQDRVPENLQSPEFFSPRDSLPKLSPGIIRPANLSAGSGHRYRIFQFWVPAPVPVPDLQMSPGPDPRFPGPELPNHRDPVPDADPWLRTKSEIPRLTYSFK